MPRAAATRGGLASGAAYRATKARVTMPDRVPPLSAPLEKQLCDLYENDCIFDKFDACMNGDATHIATGSYANGFRVFGPGGGEAALEATRDPMRRRVQPGAGKVRGRMGLGARRSGRARVGPRRGSGRASDGAAPRLSRPGAARRERGRRASLFGRRLSQRGSWLVAEIPRASQQRCAASPLTARPGPPPSPPPGAAALDRPRQARPRQARRRRRRRRRGRPGGVRRLRGQAAAPGVAPGG
jgi:hypothetical protein